MDLYEKDPFIIMKLFTSIVHVLPPPVCPYANIVPLKPEITAEFNRKNTFNNWYCNFFIYHNLLCFWTKNLIKGKRIFIFLASNLLLYFVITAIVMSFYEY